MKKLLIGFSALIALLVVVALVLPFVVDLNRFKPQVQAVVEENVNAKIDFDSVRLTILTGLGVRLANVTVTNTDPVFRDTRLFHVDALDFRISLAPLLQRKIEGYLSVDKPEIVMATKGLKNNLAALPKPSEAEPEAAEKPMTPEEIAKREATVEEFKRNVTIESLRITDASFIIRDLETTAKDEPIKITDLDLAMDDIGLERDIKVRISTDVAVKQPGVAVDGPIAVTMVLHPSTEGTRFKVATYDGKVDLDRLSINAMGAFVKEPGIALNTTFRGDVTPTTFALDDLTFNLHNLAVGAKAKVSDLASLATEASVSVVNDQLKELGKVLPQHKDLLVDGSLDLKADLNGVLAEMKDVSASMTLRAALTGSDLAVKAKLADLAGPKGKVEVQSQRLDLQAILGPFMAKNDGAPAKQEAAPAPAVDGGKPAEPAEDFALTPEQREMLKGADLALDVRLGQILFDTLEVKDFVLKSELQGLQATLAPLSLEIFDGSIVANGKVDLAATPIRFASALDMRHVAVDQITALVAPEHKDLIVGHANFDLSLEGQGTTVPTLSKNLDGKGGFLFLDGELHTGSVAAAIGEQAQGFLGGLSVAGAAQDVFAQAEKLLANPVVAKAAGGKVDLAAKKRQYEGVSKLSIADKLTADKTLKDAKGSLEIKDGRIAITSSSASEAGMYDLKASIGIDSSLGGGGTFVASAKLRDDLVRQSKYATLLFDDEGQLKLPLTLAGMAADPKVAVDFGPTKAAFQRNAKALVEKEVKAQLDGVLKNAGAAALKAKQEEARKQLQAKRDEAKAKLDAEKRRRQEEAKKKADAEKGKVKDKLKKKLGF